MVRNSTTCSMLEYLRLHGGHMDQRRATREPLRVFVDHVLGDREQCVCVSENFSRGGMQISGVPGPGWGRPRHVWLRFNLPDENATPVRALGELRYEREENDGVHVRGYSFKYMSPRERQSFNRFLDDRENPPLHS